jgi:hypothetical protein
MGIYSPEEALRKAAEEAVAKGFKPDNPQMAARMRRVEEGKTIDEKEIVAEGGCDHPDPTLSSMGNKVAGGNLEHTPKV